MKNECMERCIEDYVGFFFSQKCVISEPSILMLHFVAEFVVIFECWRLGNLYIAKAVLHKDIL